MSSVSQTSLSERIGDLSHEELSSKYQSLAQEYSRIRAQNHVLKSAVLGGRSNIDQMAEALREKDIKLRMQIEELDKSQFMNQQLTRRVSVLQQELDNKPEKRTALAGSSGYKRALNKAQEQIDVITEELGVKLEENARLHGELFEERNQHKETVSILESELDEVKEKLRQAVAKAAQGRRAYVGDRKKLDENKALRETQLENAQRELIWHQEELATLSAKSGAKIAELEKELGGLKNKFDQKHVLNDIEFNYLNIYNVPTFDRKRRTHAHRLTKKIFPTATLMICSCIELFLGLEKRTRFLRKHIVGNDENLSAVVNHLIGASSKTVEKFRKLMENCEGMKPDDSATYLSMPCFDSLGYSSSLFSDAVASANKVGSYVAEVKELVRPNWVCSVCILPEDDDVGVTFGKLLPILEQLRSYFEILTKVEPAPYPKTNREAVLGKIANALNRGSNFCKEFNKIASTVFDKEKGEMWYGNEIEQASNQMAKGIVDLGASCGNAEEFLTANICFLVSDSEYQTRGQTLDSSDDWISCGIGKPDADPPCAELEARARNYVKLNSFCFEPDSVNYEESLKNKSLLLSSSVSRDTMLERLSFEKNRAGQLERDLEHWMLEYQLNNSKLQKERKQVKQLKKIVEELENKMNSISNDNESANIENEGQNGNSTDSLSPQAEQNEITENTKASPSVSKLSKIDADIVDDSQREASEVPESVPKSKSFVENDSTTSHVRNVSVTVPDPKSKETKSTLLSTDAFNREALIKKHYTARIAQLTSQLQMADSKAASYAMEAKALAKKQRFFENQSSKATSQISCTYQEIADLKDQLSTTERNYSTQINLMTEHICSLNERLSSQNDELQAIKNR
eukprot:Nk52_evm47s1569 gene=Nk52_evmTU47s1569